MDLINRQDAIDALCDNCNNMQAVCAHYPCRQYIAVETLPSAQPERKKGKWKRKIVDSGYNADWVCSECGDRWKYDFINFNFCPNCGADMRGEDDE